MSVSSVRSDSWRNPDEFKIDETPYQELIDPPPAPEESKWIRWGKRCVCALGAGASIGLRALNLSRSTNVLGSFGAGFFAQSTLQVGFKGETLARIRQCSSTVFGQMTLFALSQAFVNVTNPVWHVALPHAIIAQFGVNVAIAGCWLYQQGGVRVEGHRQVGRETLNHSQCINHNVSHGIKFIAAAAATVGAFTLSDPILRGLSSFTSSFFLSQIAGERVIDYIGEKVQASSSAADISNEMAGTKYRYFQTALTTLSFIAQPISFIPWIKPDAVQRIKQLIIVGSSLGFFNGVADRSQKRRLKAHPIEDLEEFEKLKPPEKPTSKNCNAPTLKYLAYQVWRVSVPVISICGMLGFTLWQQLAPGELNSIDSRIALGGMLGGFLAAYPLAKWVDSTWSTKNRNWLTDKMIVALWISPRVLGINPLYIFYMGTNALPLASSEIDQLQNPYYIATAVAAYVAYGAAMGRELAITSSDRFGNAQMKYPGMVMIDSTLTAVNSFKGVVP
jgi:hypothetical protein